MIAYLLKYGMSSRIDKDVQRCDRHHPYFASSASSSTGSTSGVAGGAAEQQQGKNDAGLNNLVRHSALENSILYLWQKKNSKTWTTMHGIIFL